MRAVIFYEPGPPERLQLKEVEEPKPGRGEVILKVGACSLNRLDLWVRRGTYRARLPHILGSDVAGEVVELGEGVEGLRRGDRVLVYPALYCSSCPYCERGLQNLCDKVEILGAANTDGGYAELLKVPARNLLPLPEGLSYEEASCLPITFLTSWNALVNKARIRQGDSVLVIAGGSGVGVAAIQIAKLFNAFVIATVGSEEKGKRAKELGADAIINHYQQDIKEEALRLTDGKGVDVVVEHVGSATLPKALGALSKGGRLTTFGATSGAAVELELRQLYRCEKSIMGVFLGPKRDLERILELYKEGKLHAVLDGIYGLEGAVEAHKRMEEGRHFGKLVLRP